VKLKLGDLVRIDPMWFGYDNILPHWNDSVFVVLNVYKEEQRVADYKRMICDVLTPEGKMYQFYDYELTLASDENYLKNVLI